ncbi:MAG: CCA tRNA nucleotidyltransferase [Candidatus Aenigmarchaeota archaeon]|nr:CCA tRNA nucleotidyltransferase [Candidatus Aenigmarchaeota archaeon]
MRKEVDTVLRKALKKITPSEKLRSKIFNVVERVLSVASKICDVEGVKPLVVGSLVRDTWLPDKKEFDLFLLFPEDLSKNELERRGLEIGKKIVRHLKGRYKIEYAEHPYVSAVIKGINIDIVPCYEVKSAEKIKSSVDRTPFHLKYLKDKIKGKLKDEIRLLKRFLKANGLYGADAKVLGFSGYACELLILKYKSFVNLLKASKAWKPGEIIDIESYYTKREYPVLRKMFKNQVLILIDPTDRKRNVTAALSPYNFFRFKKLALDFLRNPSITFFFPKKKKVDVKSIEKKMKKRETKLILLSFKPPNIIPDILWPQLRKFADRLKKIVEGEKYGFRVLGSSVFTDEKKVAIVLLELEVWKLPRVQKRKGPLVFDLKDSERFLDKYKGKSVNGPYIEKNHWVVEVERRFLTVEEKLKAKLKDSIEGLELKGIPSHIAKSISNGFKIIEGEKLIEICKKNEKVRSFIYEYLKKGSLV